MKVIKEEDMTFPQDVLNCGGLVGRIADYTMEMAHRPNRELALAGAIAWVSHCMGRRFRSRGGTSPNVYLLAVGWSGLGKSAPRNTNLDLAKKLDMIDTVCDDFRSGEAVQDALLAHGKILSQYDEIDTLFEAINGKRFDAGGNNMLGELLKVWEKSKSFMTRRLLAMSQKRENQPRKCVKHPHFTLFGTGVTSAVYKSISDKMATNGFFARLIIIDGGKRGSRQHPDWKEIPEDIVNDCKDIAGWTEKHDDWKALDPASEGKEYDVPMSDEAKKHLEQANIEADAQYNEVEDGVDNAIWNRTGEKIEKLALIFAGSDYPRGPKIESRHIDLAKSLVWYSNRKQIATLKGYATESDFEALEKKILRILKRGATTRSHLLQTLHISTKDLSDVIEAMKEGDMIVFKDNSGKELAEDGKGVYYDLP